MALINKHFKTTKNSQNNQFPTPKMKKLNKKVARFDMKTIKGL